MPTLELVQYKTFVDHLETGSISDVAIYNLSSDVEITYSFNGIAYATQGPFGANRDILLHRAFESKSIEYTLLSKKYEGPEASSHKISEYTSALFFVLPVLLVVVILVQAATIKRLANKLPST